MSKQSYHHGNLKQALVDRALVMLNHLSVDQMSLRKVALAENVTPTAVYKHFANKEQLMKAVVIEGFRRFNRQVYTQDAQSVVARDRLCLYALRYFEFAIENPSLFSMMFKFQIEESDDQHPLNLEFIEVAQQAEHSFTAALCDAISDSGLEPSERIISVATITAFATAHGLTDLYRCGSLQMIGKYTAGACVIDFDNAAMRAQYLKESTEMLVDGLISQAKKSS